jgi:phage portal protein BeeE
VTSLVPLPPSRVQVRELPDWTIEYKVVRATGGFREVNAAEILHLRGDSDDGMLGCSLVDEAAKCSGCRCAPTRRPRGCSATARSPGPCSNRTSR